MVVILENSKFKGYEYDGELKNDLPNGFGILYFKNKNIRYSGSWKNGKKNGEGSLYYKNGRVKIKGNWTDDLPNGSAIFYDNEGSKYVCEYIFGKIITGTCYYTNNLIYVGELKKTLKDGFGSLYYSNGNTMYKGYFKNDKFNGHGKLYLPNGDIYEDEFKDNKMTNKVISL